MYPIPTGYSPSPSIAMPQSTTLSSTTPSIPMLHLGVCVVGTATVVLVIYNLILVKWRSYFSTPRSRSSTNGSSFKYKRDDDGAGEAYSECVVCLSEFEEGEELKKLPKCNHSFHASCIDTWLYSHTDCPLCRCTVEVPGVKRQPENYHQVMLVPVPLV